jgi:hypothetical protein
MYFPYVYTFGLVKQRLRFIVHVIDVRLVRLSGERCGNYSIVLLVATHLNILYNSWIMN